MNFFARLLATWRLAGRGDLRRIECGPDDVVILETSHRFSSAAVANLAAHARKARGAERRILVLEDGMTLRVLGGMEPSDASP